MGLIKKLFKSRSEREVKKIQPLVNKILSLEDEYKALSDDALRGKTEEFKTRLKNGETLDDILVEAFATVREAADRVLGLRAFPVQLIGGIVLHQGRIAEMKTGEGKTLVATFPSYLNALAGEGVHVVTVNDYLAKYQGELMGRVHRFLGLTVGIITHDLLSDERREQYLADITYGTNNEFGFDYLRDNMAIYKETMVQRSVHSFAIVDEVDSILIDEARTPLIISGMGEKPTAIYEQVDRLAATLRSHTVASTDEKVQLEDSYDADYIVDEKAHSAVLTKRGIEKAEKFFGIENLSDPEHSILHHHINQAIRARGLMHRDVDYVIRDGQIVIVDQFTGRLMPGRRYSEGLHQAIEAKERVVIQRESKTLATITFQNYFRMYKKLSGMTGTALTEEEEFKHIYSLDVVEIPTNRPMIRRDLSDVVYRNQAGKLRAIVRQIEECAERGQPVLVGTISIEKSELVSSLLKKKGIQHVVLNAKYHDKEAEIVAQAGKLGAVTIATNMAGRGTDIMLGGNADYMAKSDLRRAGMDEDLIVDAGGSAPTDNPEILDARRQYRELYLKHKAVCDAEAEKVREAGGLFIIGTERHESRRIDNQLRGRAGRQGDEGASRFFLALDDDIMRIFGSERIMAMADTLGMDEDTPIEQKLLTSAIETAQKKVESRNFAMRKNVLEYDDVMNKHREIIYSQRNQVLNGEEVTASIKKMLHDSIFASVAEIVAPEKYVQTYHINQVKDKYTGVFLKPEDLNYSAEDLNSWDYDAEKLAEDVYELAEAAYDAKEAEIGSKIMREAERVILLRAVDEHWMNHIDTMHELRQGIGLNAYAQRNPIDEYKNAGFEMFEEMIASIGETTILRMFTIRVEHEAPKREQVAKITGQSAGGDESLKKQPVKKAEKIGRNDPCPCGSGLKYKKCCGKDA